MANHGHATTPQIEEGELIQEEIQPTHDDKLANLYRDLSSQNELAKQIFLISALAGISYCKEVIIAYKLLKKPLDPEKLIKDPVYKKRVERSVELVKRHEGKRLKEGKSKYTATIQRTENGLKWTRFAHEKVEYVKKSLSFQYGVDMRRIYGFGDEEMKTIYQGALQRVKERPGLSMREAMRIEGRVSFLQKKSEIEVNKDEKYNNSVKRLLRRKERKEEIEKRIETHEEDFISSTSNIYELEKEFSDKRIEEGTRHVSSVLGVELKPKTAEQPASGVTPALQPQPSLAPEVVPSQVAPTATVSPPAPITSPQTPPTAAPTIIAPTPVLPPPSPSPPPSSPPTTRPSPISRLSEAFASLRQRIANRVRAGLSRVISPAKPLLRGITNLRSAFGRLGKSLVSKGLALGAKLLAKQGLKQAIANLVAPGIGGAIVLGAEIINNLTGGLLGKGAKIIIIIIIVLAVGIPVIFILLISGKGNMFSHVTSKDSVVMKAFLPKNKIYGWREFEKKFLLSSDEGPFVSWQQFEKENLILQEKYLSKNQE